MKLSNPIKNIPLVLLVIIAAIGGGSIWAFSIGGTSLLAEALKRFVIGLIGGIPILIIMSFVNRRKKGIKSRG